MAFGSLIGTFSAILGSITASTNATVIGGAKAVIVGDLVVGVLAEQTSVTVTGAFDNLGNTYTALQAGTDAGNSTGRAFYSRVSAAGNLGTVSFTCSASAHDVVAVGGIWSGPFLPSLLDKNPTQTTGDVVSPFQTPASGALAFSSEVIVGWIAASGVSSAYTAVSPMLLVADLASSNNVKSSLGYQVATATTTQTFGFNGAAPTDDVLGIMSFAQDVLMPQILM